MNPILHSRLGCWIDAGERVAAASIVEINGSTPHSTGLAIIVNSSGEIAGAVSGGCVDAVIVEACDEVLRSKQGRALSFAEDQGEFGEAGLVCGGSLRVWVYEIDATTARAFLDSSGESVMTLSGHPDRGPSHLYFQNTDTPDTNQRTTFRQLSGEEWEFQERFGRRHLVLIIGQSGFTNALASLGRTLGYEVVVCDPRRRFAAAATEAHQVVVEMPDRCIESLATQGRLNANSAIIVCTHDQKFDQPALFAAVRSPVGFIGAMGSRKTVEDRRQRLLEAGMSPDEFSRIHSPLGLDLRAQTPAETAVSVFAQWIAVQHGGSGAALNQMEGSIHASN